MNTPKLPIHESDVPIETWYANSDREIRGKALSDFGGMAKVGFGILELPPGSNTKPAHFHTHEDEHLYILEGNVILHLGGRRFPLRPGSYVHFPPSQESPHFLANDSREVVRYIMVGERIKNDQVIYIE